LATLKEDGDFFGKFVKFTVGSQIYDEAVEIEEAISFNSEFENAQEILSEKVGEGVKVVKGKDGFNRNYIAIRTNLYFEDTHYDTKFLVIGEIVPEGDIFVSHFGEKNGLIKGTSDVPYIVNFVRELCKNDNVSLTSKRIELA